MTIIETTMKMIATPLAIILWIHAIALLTYIAILFLICFVSLIYVAVNFLATLSILSPILS